MRHGRFAFMRLTPLIAAIIVAFAGSVQGQLTGNPTFNVPGVVSYQALGTRIACTNTGAGPATFTVEIYDDTGSMLATGTSGTLNTRETGSITTRSITAIASDLNLNAGIGIFEGSARIFSTSKFLMCSAIVVDSANSPPTSMASLPVVAGKKQK